MTQPTEQERPADIREAVEFAEKINYLMKGGLSKPEYWKHAMIMLADEVAQAKWHKDIAEAAMLSAEKDIDALKLLLDAFQLTVEEMRQERDGLLRQLDIIRASCEPGHEVQGPVAGTVQNYISSLEQENDGLAAKCAEQERYNVQSIANRICGEIPDEFHIEMVLENGAGWVSLFHKGKPVEIDMADWGIAEQFDVAMQCVQQIEREGGA